MVDVPTNRISGYLAAISTSILVGMILAWMGQQAVGDARTELVSARLSSMQMEVTAEKEKIEQQSEDIRALQATVHLLSSLSEINGRDEIQNQNRRQGRQQ